jgi:hypothetical protein
VLRDFGWKETRFSVLVEQPLNLTTGKYLSAITPGVEAKRIIVTHDETTPRFYFEGAQNIFQTSLFFYRQLKRSARDLRPKWGQVVDVNLGSTFLNYTFSRSFLNVTTILLAPGILKHHSSRLSLGYEKLPQGKYNNYSALLYPRGYIRQVNSELRKLSFDYKFPLLYPDLRLGPIVYLQRVKANIFLDYAIGTYLDEVKNYNSMGFELTNDLHLLNFPVPLDIGFRYIFMPSVSMSKLELILSVKFGEL